MADKFRKTKSNFATTLVTGIGTGTGDTITLNSTTGLPTDTEITLTFNRVTSGGVVNSTSVMERITGTISGATLTSYTRGVDGTTEQAHAGGTVVEYIPNAADMNDQVDGILVGHNQDGTHKSGIVLTTPVVNGAVTGTITPPKTFYGANFNAPEGFLINGKIVPSVANNDLTVALKGLDGNDPSATNPVYCRIGDTVRSITSALSIVSAAGTNYLNLGSAETATKGTDLFVYLGINATDDAPILLVSRVPSFSVYSQFASGNTAANSKLYSTEPIGATSNVVNIGRFSATLSAGAGYTWSVPTFTTANLIQRPIFETSKMDYKPTVTGFSGTPTATATYQLVGRRQYVFVSSVTGTSNATGFTISYPNIYDDGAGYEFFFGNDNNSLGLRTMEIGSTGTLTLWPTTGVGNWTASGAKSMAGCRITIRE